MWSFLISYPSFTFILIFLLINNTSHADLSQFSLPLDNTSKLGLFVRTLNSDTLYLSNHQKDIKYNYKTKDTTIYGIKSVYSRGSVCPLVMTDSNGEPSYLFIYEPGDKHNYLRVYSYQTNSLVTEFYYYQYSIITKSYYYDCRGMFQYEDKTAYAIVRTSGSGTAYRDIIKIDIEKKTQTYYNIQTAELAAIPVSNNLILSLNFYNNFYYTFTDMNFTKIVEDEQINGSGKDERINEFYQMVEIANKRIIVCFIMDETKSNVGCLSGVYDITAYTFEVQNNLKSNVLENCSTDSEHDSFSMYKLTEQSVVIGCGTSDLQIVELYYNLQSKGNVIKITESNYSFLDFSVLTSDKLYIVLAVKSGSTYSYYGDVYYLPKCQDQRITIKSGQSITLQDYIPTLVEGQPTPIKIVFPSFQLKGSITYEGNSVNTNTVYDVSKLVYTSEQSVTESIQYQVISYVFGNEINYSTSTICKIIIVVCHKSCETCETTGSDVFQKCTSCNNIGGYYLSENSDDTTCYNSNTIKENYYLDIDNKLYKKCYDSCKTCDSKGDANDNKCTSCAIEKEYYPIEDMESNCINYQPEGYALYNKKYMKCYEACGTCSNIKIGSIHNCLTCKEGYIQHPHYTQNCVHPCGEDSKWYYPDSSYDIICNSKCPDNKPLSVHNEDYPDLGEQCVFSCKDTSCVNCEKDKLLYEYNGKCIKECPNGISHNNVCWMLLDEKSTPIITSSTLNYKMDSDISTDIFKGLISQAIELGITTNKGKSSEDSLTSLKSKNYTFDLYPSNINSSIVKESGSPVVELKECEKILRDTYNIPDNEELYIGQIVYKNTSENSASNQVQYEVYRENKEKVDLEPCEGTNITITQSIINTENINLELAKLFLSQGIDIYDENDAVFNDRCTSMSIDGKDISMEDRRNKIHKKVNFCSDGCEVDTLNLTTNEVECVCSVKSDGFNSVLEENEIFSTFSSLLTSTNINLFLCLKLVGFFPSDFLPNYGNWIMLPSLIGIIVCTLIFLFIQMKAIYSNLNKYINLNPPIKIEEVDDMFKCELESNPNQLRTGAAFIKLPLSKDHLDTNISNGEIKKEENSKEDEEEPSPEELNEMEYRDALKEDTRSFFQYFISIFAEKQIIVSTIVNHSVFYPLSLRLVLLLFTLTSFFFLNAILYTEEYITERYSTKESLDIWYIIKNEISKSVYSSLIGMFITKFVSMLLSSGKSFQKLLKEKGDSLYFQNFKILVSDMKTKYFIVLVIVIGSCIGYWYFIYIFCYIYKSNQVSWIESSLFSILFNIILPLFICMVVAILRIVSLRLHFSFLFSISYCFYQIF